MTLQPFNTIPLVALTPLELSIPGGTYTVFILNLGPGDLFLKRDGTVAQGDPASFTIPLHESFSVLASGSLWIASDQAGSASVALIPKP
jgi:hypothetical protein